MGSIPSTSASIASPPQANSLPLPVLEDPAILSLLAESVSVTKRKVLGRKFRVSAQTVSNEEMRETQIDREEINITRVPINQFVEAMPEIRIEGDTTIMPIVEERLFTVKRLFVVEEVHLTRVKQQEIVQTPVQIRRQHAVIECFDPTPAINDASLQAEVKETNNGHS